MRFTGYVTTGEDGVFSPGTMWPSPGSLVMVTLPSGERVEGKLISAERVSGSRVRMTIEVPGVVSGVRRDPSPPRLRQECR